MAFPLSYQKVHILNCGLFDFWCWSTPFWTFSTFLEILFWRLPNAYISKVKIKDPESTLLQQNKQFDCGTGLLSYKKSVELKAENYPQS